MKRRSFMKFLGLGGAAVAAGGFAVNEVADGEPLYFEGEAPEDDMTVMKHSSAGGTIAMFVSTT